MRLLPVFVASTLLTVAAGQLSKADSTDEAFAKIQSLAGDWEGTAVHAGGEMPATVSFRLVADKSTVMADLVPGTPHEMVTMFHMDGKELLATHYCSHHNQPRLRAIENSSPNVIEFVFKDATNLSSPADPHMTDVKFTIPDASHHTEEWTATANGAPMVVRFDFRRKQ